MAKWHSLWINANIAAMTGGGVAYGAKLDAAIAVDDDKIAWLGSMSDLPGPAENLAETTHDCAGRWITPGLIDCHTHLVFGGNRVREFELRLNGASYEEIARAGGGIRSTVAATRGETERELFNHAERRLQHLMGEGVTTVEIKSGYGLDTETEMKMLRVARKLGEKLPVRVKTTFLGAHALPAEYAGDSAGYIDLVCREMIPAVAAEGLADAVDVFCEGIGFTVDETRRVFEAAAVHKMQIKAHTEQLSNLGGTQLACEYGALSADHLEYLDEAGVEAMASSGTAAVLLPGAFYFLRETQLPPVDALRKNNVPIAVATDLNPGSSPAQSILTMMNMSATLFQMTPEEALAGVSIHAAKALGMQAELGVLDIGKAADFVIWDIAEPAELTYWIGNTRPDQIIFGGNVRS